VLVRSGHGVGRARVRVPTCSARPAPRYAVWYRFHFSARRALVRGIGDFFFGNQSGVLRRTSTGRLGALYCAPIRGPGRLYYVSKVVTPSSVTNSVPIPVLSTQPLMSKSITEAYMQCGALCRPKHQVRRLWGTRPRSCKLHLPQRVQLMPTRACLCALSTSSSLRTLGACGLSEPADCSQRPGDTLYLLYRAVCICAVSVLYLALYFLTEVWAEGSLYLLLYSQ
jgi:hypothetical protein